MSGITVVLVVPDERLAKVIRSRGRAFTVYPEKRPVTLRILVDANVMPTEQKTLDLVSYLAELGAEYIDAEPQNLIIHLGWPRTETPAP